MRTVSTTRPARSGWRLGLAVLLIALTGAAFDAAHAQTPPGPGLAMGGMGMGGWGRGPGGGMSERMLDLAGASADQKAKVREIFAAMGKDLRTQWQAGQALHTQLTQALLAPSVDPAAVDALRQKMLAQHDTASKRMMQAMLDASAVLTPEQRGKLAQALQQRREMFERHRRERESLDPGRG